MSNLYAKFLCFQRLLREKIFFILFYLQNIPIGISGGFSLISFNKTELQNKKNAFRTCELSLFQDENC